LLLGFLGGAPHDRVTRCLFRDDVGVSMRVYLALGDSISIDDYTGVHGGGAVSQLAHRLGAELVDLTRDGNTTHGVLADLARAPAAADVVTLTAGGNDLLAGELPRAILRRLDQIAQRIQPLGARVVINTVYDPSDGDNDLGRRELGLSRLAAIELRRRLNSVNRGIKRLADEHGLLLADLELLFHGHGVTSSDPWFVQVIEPNLAGATATAEHWHDLLTSSG
jgi:lysophospholipase L1-like esterase